MTCKQMETLITDARFQELKFRQERTNVFTIVGQTHTEHWHSSFLSWLLDAHSSLRLGHFPLARLLNLYMMKKPDCVLPSGTSITGTWTPSASVQRRTPPTRGRSVPLTSSARAMSCCWSSKIR